MASVTSSGCLHRHDTSTYALGTYAATQISVLAAQPQQASMLQGRGTAGQTLAQSLTPNAKGMEPNVHDILTKSLHGDRVSNGLISEHILKFAATGRCRCTWQGLVPASNRYLGWHTA